METPTQFAKAFDADLKASGLEQSKVCELLTEPGEPVLTTAAISNWKKRDKVPERRLAKLAEIFGPGSNCAQLYNRVGSTAVPMPSEYSELDTALQEGRVTAVPIGTVRAAVPAPTPPPREDQLQTFEAQLAVLLRSVPESRRTQAYLAASQALMRFLPGAK